jgi:chemotaxis signal transduction protein
LSAGAKAGVENGRAAKRARSLLIVRLAGREYALEAGSVRGAMQLRGQSLQPVRSRGPFRHVVSKDSRVLAVATPHARLGLRERPVTARTALVIIERPAAEAGAVSYAVLVDSVSRMERVREVDFRREAWADWAGASVRLSGKWRPVLDLDAVFPPEQAREVTRGFDGR